MKTILAFLSLCFCTTLYAQDENTTSKQKEETSGFAPFGWYQKQEEEKEAFLLEKLNIQALAGLKKKGNNKLVIILNMPVYTGPKGLSLMPVLPIDTTNTYYLKIYPAKD